MATQKGRAQSDILATVHQTASGLRNIGLIDQATMRHFDDIRDYLDGAGHDVTVHDDGLMCIELSLEHGRRHQAIFLTRMSDEDGRAYLRVSTVVAPMTGVDPRRALAFNWESQVGHLAVGDLDGVPHLQL